VARFHRLALAKDFAISEVCWNNSKKAKTLVWSCTAPGFLLFWRFWLLYGSSRFGIANAGIVPGNDCTEKYYPTLAFGE
jgi:hypothetical protein